MLLDRHQELELGSNRPRTLIISVIVHLVLLLLIAFNPDWFESSRRRVIRIAGEDFDANRLEFRELALPPLVRRPAPAPAPPPPAVAQQQPLPAPVPPPQAAPPPPPPPPPQPPPPIPDRVIRPDDVLAEGARPDGSPRASRGDTRESLRTGGAQGQQSQEAQQAQAEQQARAGQQAQTPRNDPGADRIAQNTNPDALRAPNSLLSSAGRIVESQIEQARRAGQLGRTGLAHGDSNGSFATDEPQILSPNPKGIDFGPYLNQLLTRLRTNWFSVMPEMARLGQQGRVMIDFTVTKTGGVREIQVVVNSGFDALDKGALSAIQLSNPFQRLPAEYDTDLKLRISFLYNMSR